MASKHRGEDRRADTHSRRRRFRIAAMILLFVLVEVICVIDISSTDIWPYNHWLGQTVATLAAGRPVPPDNKGPWDFRMFWSAGHLAATGRAADAYSPSEFQKFETEHKATSDQWIYPPTVMLLSYLTSFVSFGAGFLIWTLGLNLLSVLVMRGVGLGWLIIVATLMSPAALWSDALGQFGLVGGALFLASLMIASRRPVRAGLYAGLLTMKPQIGLILPVVFLAQRNVRAIVVAVLVFLVLVALSLLAFGGEVWRAYLTEGLASAHAIVVSTHGNAGMFSGISVFWFTQKLGLGLPVSYGLQVAAAFGAAIWCWRAWSDPLARPLPRVALTTCLASFVTPYAFIDGLCAFTAGIGLLVWDRGYLRPYDAVLWIFPLLGFNLSVLYDLPVMPPVMLLAAVYAHRQMRRTTQVQPAPGGGIEPADAGQVT